MKKTIIIPALGAILLASCADDFDRSYEVGKPANLAEYGYLNDLQPLKSYIDRAKYPNFKLGVGTVVNDYLKQELVYGLTNSNFDEVVPGNEMKMASCVNDRGVMDFGNIGQFVSAATDAGLSVYGHTLFWHEQQPVKYLNSLLKDKELEVDPDALIETLVSTKTYQDGPFPFYVMGCEPPVINGCLHFEPTGEWSQFFIFPGGENPLTEGNYLARLYMTADKDAEGVQITIQNGWGGSDQNITQPIGVKAGTQVYEISFQGVVGGNYDVILKPQTADAVLDVEKIEFYKLETPAVEMEQEIYTQDWTTADGYTMWGQFPDAITAGPTVGGDGLTITTTATIPNFWELQYMVADGITFKADTKYVMHITMKGSPEGSVHYVIGAWGADIKTGQIAFKDGWATQDIAFTTTAETSGVHVLLQSGDYAGTYTVKDVVFGEMVSLNSIPLTDEEKHDTLVYAMEQWISGMMEVCEGKVKAWDVVNEAISGVDADGDGIYDLQHAQPEGGDNLFFWQDHMGDLEYVRQAVRLARQYGPEGVKLFVNDYNLEYDWDLSGNKKLESLIAWIDRWEADGVTKIDGIGSQMHVSLYLDETKHEKQKELIKQSFKLMAATRKLVRVSELDMGIIDASGKEVGTNEVSEEQHKAMAEFYKWIVATYMNPEVVPVDQQWGICQWAATDSPAGSGWRPNCPLGLWDLNYNRKHTYAGFADGLQGK